MAGQYLFTFAIIAIVLPIVTFAAEFIVGDEVGWKTGNDYEGWAKGKEFRVGDKLVFKYAIGLHNVYQVKEDSYKNCIIPQDGVLATGEDTIPLDSPGPKYFVCGVGLHCENGQKLSINVKQGDTESPNQGPKTPSESLTVAPSESPAANGLPNATPSQSSSTIGSPYATPPQLPIANDSPNGAPSQSSVSSDSSNGEFSPAPSSSNSSNGFRMTGYHLPLVEVGVIVALIVF